MEGNLFYFLKTIFASLLSYKWFSKQEEAHDRQSWQYVVGDLQGNWVEGVCNMSFLEYCETMSEETIASEN